MDDDRPGPRRNAQVTALFGAPLADALESELASLTGTSAPITQAARVGGGSISPAFRLQVGREAWFLKLDVADRHAMFDAEADGLLALGRCAALRVPCVVAHGVCERQAYLLLEHLDLEPLRNGAAAAAAGRALAELHRMTGPQFGWHRDNFLGSTVQENRCASPWPDFFASHRLLPQLALAARNGIRGRLLTDGERLAAELDSLFDDYVPPASLLHGDLWSGNAAVDEDGRLCLFDPAVHYGDRECDLAMMALFGGFPPDMLAAYREAWPLAAGAEVRRDLYQLYHVLNHLNLFGDSYRAQAEHLLGRLVSALR